mmetsp:Transcript_57133/g.121271  ORF Transcript_57133/g.121271 Transcript_57133/m.121271 type:complete len:213 (+) Transcript_57133:229-867(+)
MPTPSTIGPGRCTSSNGRTSINGNGSVRKMDGRVGDGRSRRARTATTGGTRTGPRRRTSSTSIPSVPPTTATSSRSCPPPPSPDRRRMEWTRGRRTRRRARCRPIPPGEEAGVVTAGTTAAGEDFRCSASPCPTIPTRRICRTTCRGPRRTPRRPRTPRRHRGPRRSRVLRRRPPRRPRSPPWSKLRTLSTTRCGRRSSRGARPRRTPPASM